MALITNDTIQERIWYLPSKTHTQSKKDW